MKRRWWILSSAAIFAGLAVAIPTVRRWLDREPMTSSLPARYQTEPFDIWRQEAGLDFALCMRVALSPEEVAAFIPKFFDQKSDGVAINMVGVPTMCEAPFWPAQFETKTIAFEQDDPPRPNRDPESGQGAVYERGNLYFWSYSF